MRKGAERLAVMIQSEFNLDPCAEGVLYVFSGMQKNRIRGITWDGDGWAMLVKKKQSGHFSWPDEGRKAEEITYEELARILGSEEQEKKDIKKQKRFYLY